MHVEKEEGEKIISTMTYFSSHNGDFSTIAVVVFCIGAAYWWLAAQVKSRKKIANDEREDRDKSFSQIPTPPGAVPLLGMTKRKRELGSSCFKWYLTSVLRCNRTRLEVPSRPTRISCPNTSQMRPDISTQPCWQENDPCLWSRRTTPTRKRSRVNYVIAEGCRGTTKRKRELGSSCFQWDLTS